MRGLPDFKTHPISFETAKAQGFFRAKCYDIDGHTAVVDGDTADFMVDLGWNQYVYLTIRFKDIDTEEIRGTSGDKRAFGLAATERVKELILGQHVLIKTTKNSSFNRIEGRYSILREIPHKLRTMHQCRNCCGRKDLKREGMRNILVRYEHNNKMY